jgi:RNA polymerase sigma factor (sigma-70 family)
MFSAITQSTTTRRIRHTESTDTGLLRLVREGDDRAYGELWRRHAGVGAAIARRVTTRIDSADVVAESFARMLQAIRNGAGPRTAVRSYLATTIRAVCATWGRAQHETVGLDCAPELGFVDERLDRIDDVDSLDMAVAAFKTLPERWQTALWYSEVEGLSNAEIAKILNIKASAAAMLTSRARAGLRRSWHENEVA